MRLYADMALQALFALAIVYGWIIWARGRAGDGEIAVVPLSPMRAFAAAAGSIAIGWMTSHYTDAALPWVDATLSSFSLVAQYWTARCHAANWVLWIIVDTLYIGMFVYKGLLLTAGLYAAMIALAAMGYRRWRQVAAQDAACLSAHR